MNVGHETCIHGSATRAEDRAHYAVWLSCTSIAERTVFNGRTTVQQPLTDAAAIRERRITSEHAVTAYIKRIRFKVHPDRNLGVPEAAPYGLRVGDRMRGVHPGIGLAASVDEKR